MHPGIDNLKAELASVESLLRQPSANDETFRALLRELKHSEDVQQAILTWAPKATAALDTIVNDLTEENAQKDERIAALEADLAALKTAPATEAVHPVDAITGYTRPQLMAVEKETG